MSKVLIFADPDSIHTKKWAEGWKFIGYNPTISGISKETEGREYIIEGDISSIGGNGKVYLKKILKFKNILKEVNPFIINAHYLTSYGFISAIVKREQDFLVLFLPGTDIMKTMDKNKLYLLMSKYVFSKSDIIVSVSDVMTAKIMKYFPYLKSKIITQQYGVDIKLLNKYKSEKKDILISTNRQWKPNSNYPIILKSLMFFSHCNLKLIGAGNDEYSLDLLDKYRELNKYSTGIILYKKNLKYIAKSKIFISLTSSDGIPLSLVEAIYLGAIPIVSDIAPNRELITDGINGFVISVDSEELITSINSILNLNQEKILKMQKYNENLVLKKFDFKKNFLNLKKKIMAKYE